MGFLNSVKQGIEIVKLNRNAISEVAKDKYATNYGLIVLIIAGLLAVALRYNEISYIGLLIVSPIFFIVVMAAITTIIQIFIRLLHGPVRYKQLFKVLSISAVMCWLWIFVTVPVVGMILKLAVLIWGVVVSIVAVEVVYRIKPARAIAAVLIPFLIAVAVIWIVGVIAVSSYVPL